LRTRLLNGNQALVGESSSLREVLDEAKYLQYECRKQCVSIIGVPFTA